MTRFINLLFIFIIITFIGCYSSKIYPHKNWHTSPSSNSQSSTIYYDIEWKKLGKLYIGMSEQEVEEVLGVPLQYYDHPINAIIYSTNPEGRKFEIALKRSKNGLIEDISYK